MLGWGSQNQQGSRQPVDKTSKYFHRTFKRHDEENSVVLRINLWRILVIVGQIPMVQCKRMTGSFERINCVGRV